MKTTPVTADDLAGSVLAVPPLARHADYSLNHGENVKLIRHLEDGGITTLLYGGNANFYHVGAGEYPAVLDMLAAAAGEGTWVIPSVGPTFGTMMDQARVLRDYAFPTAMILPMPAQTTPAGVAIGVRRFVEAFGRPAVLYIKQDGAVDVDDAARLVDDGLIAAIKYAVVRDDPRDDALLGQLVDRVDLRHIVSGIGEQPAVVHLRDFGAISFTSGCVCIAPRRSMDMLRALQAGDVATAESIRAAFAPLETLRNTISPIRVLHEAVRLAGIADTGPLLPLLSNVDEQHHAAIAGAARNLLAYNLSAPVEA